MFSLSTCFDIKQYIQKLNHSSTPLSLTSIDHKTTSQKKINIFSSSLTTCLNHLSILLSILLSLTDHKKLAEKSTLFYSPFMFKELTNKSGLTFTFGSTLLYSPPVFFNHMFQIRSYFHLFINIVLFSLNFFNHMF